MSRIIGPDSKPMEVVVSGMEMTRCLADGVFTFGVIANVGGLDFIGGWKQDSPEFDIDKACSTFRKCLEAARSGI